jgi:hypothetical protein
MQKNSFRMNQNIKPNVDKLLIAESMWDVKCFKSIYGLDIRYFLLYDYTKKGKRGWFYRGLRFILALFLFFYNMAKNNEIIISDLNREGIWLLRIPYRKKYAFFPNVLVKGEEKKNYQLRNKSLLPLAQDRKVFFSDNVTVELFGGSYPDQDLFHLDDLEDIKINKNSLFLIILPASFTHHHTSDNAEERYRYLVTIGLNILKLGFNVYFKPHPRDWKTNKNRILNLVPSNLINFDKEYAQNIVYISYFSSVSLNKRYGAGFGLWLCDSYQEAEKDTFEELYRFSISSDNLFSKLGILDK